MHLKFGNFPVVDEQMWQALRHQDSLFCILRHMSCRSACTGSWGWEWVCTRTGINGGWVWSLIRVYGTEQSEQKAHTATVSSEGKSAPALSEAKLCLAKLKWNCNTSKGCNVFVYMAGNFFGTIKNASVIPGGSKLYLVVKFDQLVWNQEQCIA